MVGSRFVCRGWHREINRTYTGYSKMSLDPITGVEDLITAVINKFPDGNAKAAAQVQVAQIKASGELAEITAATDLSKGQQSINQIEAASTNWFVAGWRPAVGWVCAIALALVYWPKAILLTYVWAWQSYTIIHAATDPNAIILPPFPDLGVKELLGLLTSMLGIAGMRMVEKFKGVARN